MFKWFRNTGRKLETGITKTVDEVEDVLLKTNQLIDDSRHKIEALSILLTLGLGLSIVSSIVSIAVNTTIFTVNKKI